MAPTIGMPCAAISSQAGRSSARNAATTRWVTALGTTLRYIARCSAAKLEQSAGCAPGRRRRCRPVAAANATANAVGDRIVAIGEVLIEDLSADPGAGDQVADGDLVDGPFMGQRERRVAQQGADPFGAGIGAVGACGHGCSVRHFVDK